MIPPSAPSIAPPVLPSSPVPLAALLRAITITITTVMVMVIAIAMPLLTATSLLAQEREDANAFVPGFGFVLGEGRTENDAETGRYGFTSRRLDDGNRIGSLAMLYEEHTDGLTYDLLDSSLTEEDVELTYQSLFFELKRYFPLAPRTFYYWGIRGGYSRVRGRIDQGAGQPSDRFETTSAMPLALLALPFVLEHPGYFLLAFTDGASLGMTFDLTKEQMWLDFQISATILPTYRNDQIVLDELIQVTRTLQWVLVF